MNKVFDLVRQLTATVGTGTITLGSAATGFRTFAQGLAVTGDICTYTIADRNGNNALEWGVYDSTGPTLTRGGTYPSGTAVLSLSGSAEIISTVAAEDLALVSPILSGTVSLPGVGATTWDSAGLHAYRVVWDGINDGSDAQPIFDLFDRSMDPAIGSTGVAMRFFGRQVDLADVEGGVINGGLKVTTTGATKGDIDFVVYGWNGTTLSELAAVALDGQTVAWEPTTNSIVDLGTSGQGWRDFYLARAMFLNASAGTAGQVPISAGAGAAVAWGSPSAASLTGVLPVANGGFGVNNGYEAGTWTPSDFSNGLSLTVTDARYVRVGKLCTVSFSITYPSTADGTVNLIGGLPFTSYAGTNAVGGGALSYTNVANELKILVTANAATFQFYGNGGTAPTNAVLSTFVFRATFTYQIA